MIPRDRPTETPPTCTSALPAFAFDDWAGDVGWESSFAFAPSGPEAFDVDAKNRDFDVVF